MLKRLFCLLLALLLIPFSLCAAAEEQAKVHALQFDLAFSLDAESFPALSRARVRGYQELLDRTRLQGTVVWSDGSGSMDLNASFFFTDKPETAIPFRLYGTEERLCLTSPLLNDETVLFNMSAFMEYALKVKSTLNIPLPWLAFCYPYTTKHALRGPVEVWNKVIRKVTKSMKINTDRLQKLTDRWDEKLQSDQFLNIWINALASGSTAPEAVEMELFDFPFYFRDNVWAGHRLRVEIGEGTETWKNRQGQTLFNREQTDHSDSWVLSLPASQNGYIPYLSWSDSTAEQTRSFSLNASWKREAKAPAAEEGGSEAADKEEGGSGESDSEGAYSEDSYSEEGYSEEGYSEEYSEEYYEEYAGESGEESEYDEGGSSLWPDCLLELTAEGKDLPVSLPADSAFTFSADLSGALFPDGAFTLLGETKKDGSLSVSLCKPSAGEDPQTVILKCEGTLVPFEPETVPAFEDNFHEGSFSLFSFNEEKLAAFKKQVFPSLLQGLVRFVAEAPAPACQSFLDDLTDAGLLEMLLE